MAALSLAPPRSAPSSSLQLPDFSNPTLFPALGSSPSPTSSPSRSPSTEPRSISPNMSASGGANNASGRGQSPARGQGSATSVSGAPALLAQASKEKPSNPGSGRTSVPNRPGPQSQNPTPMTGPPLASMPPTATIQGPAYHGPFPPQLQQQHQSYASPAGGAQYHQYPHHPSAGYPFPPPSAHSHPHAHPHPHSHPHAPGGTGPSPHFPPFVQHPSYHQAHPFPGGPFGNGHPAGAPFGPPGSGPSPHLMMQAYHHQQQHFQQQILAQQQQHPAEFGRGSVQLGARSRTLSGGGNGPPQSPQQPSGGPWSGAPSATATSSGFAYGGGYHDPHGSSGYRRSSGIHHNPGLSSGSSAQGGQPSFSGLPNTGVIPLPPQALYVQSSGSRGSSGSVNSQGQQHVQRLRTDSGSSAPPGSPLLRQRTDSQTSAGTAGRSGTPPGSSGSAAGGGAPKDASASATSFGSVTSSGTITGGIGTGAQRKPSPLAQSAFTPRSAAVSGSSGAGKRPAVGVQGQGQAQSSGNGTGPPSPDDDEGDESSSDMGRVPGHRSTPGTSVDSTVSSKPSSAGPALAPLPEGEQTSGGAPALLQKSGQVGRKSLSNKFRRALSMGAMHEVTLQPQSERAGSLGSSLGSGSSGEALKSGAASIGGIRSPAPSASSGRRFGLLNSRANGSTDNLSISSTVSSASVMIRKLGHMGKAARRSSVMGISRIFKDKDKDGEGTAKGLKLSPSGSGKASTSVTQATAEVDRASTEFPGMTPAAALVQKQKQQYAEQEAAAAAAATKAALASGASTASAASSAALKGSNVGKSKTTDDAVSDAKRKAIEKEKEKLKSRKGRRWGFGGSFSGGSGSDAANAAKAVVEEQQAAIAAVQQAQSSDDWDDRTPRGSVEVLNEAANADPPAHGARPDKSYFDDDTASSRYEELGPPADFTDGELLDEYDAASLRGYGEAKLRPRPAREAVPRKGILKNGRDFSQEEFLNPKPAEHRSRASSCDAHGHRTSHPPSSLGTFGNVMLSEAHVDGVASGSEGRSASPSIAPSPYNQPALNASAPVVSGLAAPIPTRSATSPPSARRATFAQNLSVHSTWPPAVYDRRGELATCNRLTPALAQRIKEELNSFKMEEMLVHQASRVHTHFFS